MLLSYFISKMLPSLLHCITPRIIVIPKGTIMYSPSYHQRNVELY